MRCEQEKQVRMTYEEVGDARIHQLISSFSNNKELKRILISWGMLVRTNPKVSVRVTTTKIFDSLEEYYDATEEYNL